MEGQRSRGCFFNSSAIPELSIYVKENIMMIDGGKVVEPMEWEELLECVAWAGKMWWSHHISTWEACK